MTRPVTRRLVAHQRIQIELVEKELSSGDKWSKLFASIAEFFLHVWFLMLGLGAAHSLWSVIPAAGYWTSALLMMGLSALGQCANTRRKLTSGAY